MFIVFTRLSADWGEYAHPRVGIAERLRAELKNIEGRGSLRQLSIFMSSSTDPYQGLERHWRLTRACLDVFADYPPGLLIVQTRSPLVEDDFARLQRLGSSCWLNFTLETDSDDVRKVVTPACPSISRRLSTLRTAQKSGLNIQITVSPCLPFSSVEQFGSLLLDHAQRVIVDSYTSGDGQAGRRTARTGIPSLYSGQGWEEWNSEQMARSLFAWLQRRIGVRAGWSQDGFVALAKQTVADC